VALGGGHQRRDPRGAPARAANHSSVRAVFVVYLVLIWGGIAAAVVVGLTHH
jgi:hypothetical protein